VVLINGQPETNIAVTDRGLQYGDGLFETLAFRNGQLELLQAHLARLIKGCERLKLKFTEVEKLKAELSLVCQQTSEDSVIKIILTRGSGGRGYKAPIDNEALRIVSCHPMPDYPDANHTGIKVRLCDQRLGLNPSLAGIKHLNRLEQVLARSEWDDASISEGLMLDSNDKLIEGTMSNVFLVKNNKLLTPTIKHSGISGIMRAEIIKLAVELGIECDETDLGVADLLQAEEVFVSNSVINIWPVTELADKKQTWEHGPITQKLQSALTTLAR